MIQALKSLFTAEAPPAESQPKLREERLKVATCVILLEIALADDEFTPEERDKALEALQTRFTLSEEDANELITLSTQHRKESRDLWEFTHQINEHCDRNEKMEIIDEVWRIIFADGSIDGHENHLAHQLAKLMNLTHGQLIDSKTKILKEVRQS